MKHPSLFYDGNLQSSRVLIQMVNAYEWENIEKEAALIRSMAPEYEFLFVAVKTENWNNDLSPWPAPPVFGKEAFGGGAERTLEELRNEVIPSVREDGNFPKQIYLGGYSLAGLFALWTAYQTDLFSGIAAVSPSVWFPGFADYAKENRILTDLVYLSLGDREERTRNKTMAGVGDAIREIHNVYRGRQITTVLEWNEGNHFREPEVRTAKGFAWLLKQEYG